MLGYLISVYIKQVSFTTDILISANFRDIKETLALLVMSGKRNYINPLTWNFLIISIRNNIAYFT